MSNIGEVNSFYGVDGPGNYLPGPYRPFGLVRLSPDVASGQPTSGYRSGRPILTFSHTHVAGTGGGGALRKRRAYALPGPSTAKRRPAVPATKARYPRRNNPLLGDRRPRILRRHSLQWIDPCRVNKHATRRSPPVYLPRCGTGLGSLVRWLGHKRGCSFVGRNQPL